MPWRQFQWPSLRFESTGLYVRRMHDLTEQHRVGLDYLADVTALMRRVRVTHPTWGLFEAADFQWWWSQRPRATDELPQLFWFDRHGRPEAAVIATDWGGGKAQLDPIVMPGSTPEWIEHVVDRGLVHAGENGIGVITLEVDPADDVLPQVLADRGFADGADGVVETWIAADARPGISPLQAGYRLTDRLETAGRPHHMLSVERNMADPTDRLRQTSLYRPDLDLVVLDSTDGVAAYGLFWYDPETRTGLVEPMRTEDAHQRRGLARHVLTVGLDRLAEAGADRVKICYEPGNPASSHLYVSVGFQVDRQTRVYSRGTNRDAA
jgi:RimJ/RimL family protein N-acetyltransferase